MDEHLPLHQLTRSIIHGFYEVYNHFGYGLLETIYTASLERELRRCGHEVAREYGVEVRYKGEPVGFQRLDMVVDGKVVVEVKSTFAMHQAFKRQVIAYLAAMRMPLGLLLHFGPEPKVYRLHSRHGPFGSGTLR